MFRIAFSLVALLAASPSLAVRLPDGPYKIDYSPAPCGIETKHYLHLTGPTDEATFNPIPESQAQIWTVTTSATDSTWRRLESVKYSDVASDVTVTLGYPTAKDGIRIRGDNGKFGDFDTFNLIDTGKNGYYYVFPISSRDFVVNGDTRTEPGNRFAYFRGNITNDKFPLPMLPLRFTPAVAMPNVPSS